MGDRTLQYKEKDCRPLENAIKAPPPLYYGQHPQNIVQILQSNTGQEEPQMAETTKQHDRIAALKNALGAGLYEKDKALRF